MRFVETPVFTAAIRRHLDDEQYRRLQIARRSSLLHVLRCYSKAEQGDLSPAQARQLGRLVREEFK